jgi:putative sterol carrier protein
MSLQYDINNNPIYTPSLNQENYDFRLQDKLNEDSFEFNRSRLNNDDILTSSLNNQFDDNEISYCSNVNSPMQNIEPHIQNMITAAETQMHTNPENEVRRTYPIFEIININLGRRKRDINYPDEAKHNKFEKKNVLTKTKKTSYNNYMKFFNKELENTEDTEIKKEKIKLKKIDNSVLGVFSKKDNLALLKMPMKDILSNQLSNNHTTIDKDYNKNAIKFILRGNDEKLISLLNKDFENVIRVFGGDLKDKDFDGFKTIEDEIKKIENKIKKNPSLEPKERKYIKTYRYYAKNYKQTLLDMDKRAPRKKKND